MQSMSLEESTDNISELDTLAALPSSDAQKNVTVSFNANIQDRRPSFFEQSWHRKDSSTRVKDSNKFISFHDIVYQVPVKKWCQEQPPKVILHRIRFAYVTCIEISYC